MMKPTAVILSGHLLFTKDFVYLECMWYMTLYNIVLVLWDILLLESRDLMLILFWYKLEVSLLKYVKRKAVVRQIRLSVIESSLNIRL